MSFNPNLYPVGEHPIDTPQSSDEGMWPDFSCYPTERALPHGSPYSSGFVGASPLPTSTGFDSSSTFVSTRLPLNIEAQQNVGWTNFGIVEQSTVTSYQGERRVSDSSGTTDSSYEDTMNGLQGERWVSESQTSATTDAAYYEDSMNNLREKTQSLSLESRDTEVTSSSNSTKPIDVWDEIQLFILSEGWALVPQGLYQPRGETDMEKYVHTAKLSPPIFFHVEKPRELGIALDQTRSRRLEDGEDHVLEDCGGSISVRIQWPGYRPWKGQVHTRDYRKTPGPITKARLAKNLAQCVRRFIDKMTTRPMEVDADPTWKIGGGHIKYEDLILVSLHHVSKGSWQPQLRLRRQIAGPSSRVP